MLDGLTRGASKFEDIGSGLKNNLASFLSNPKFPSKISSTNNKVFEKQSHDLPSIHSYPLTQAFDILAEQELELRLHMFNYDQSISYSQHTKVKNRRGGKAAR